MNVSAEAREWIRKAESDLAAARLLAESAQVLDWLVNRPLGRYRQARGAEKRLQ